MYHDKFSGKIWSKLKLSIYSLKIVSATFLLICFLSLNESTCQTKEKCFLFHIKNSFCSWEN